jgi:tRNA A-37 threonylcarbamoyl transferase component Bud32
MDTHSRGTPSAAPGPSPGDTVLGCFRLERQIGAGSFATAYLAEQLGTDRRAVVKLPHPHLLNGPHGTELRRRFEAEAKAATRAKHPNLVTVYLVGETHYGVPAIAMEHVVGESLNDRLLRAAPLPVPELIAIGTQLADALATLHAVGIVHRDLSPTNVLITEQVDGGIWVKLLDFGVAKLLDAPSRTLGPMGTPGYLAPEQLLGSVTPRADVYSLGALLWWAITGREREDDYSDGSLRRSLGRRFGPDPRAHRSDAPSGLAHMISRALIPDPQLRPTMAEFLLGWRAAAAEPTAVTSAPLAAAPTHSERSTTARAQAARVALICNNPVVRAQVCSFLRERFVDVLEPSPRELGRAVPGDFNLAILDEESAEIGTDRFVAHLGNCYPELIVVVMGVDDQPHHDYLDAGAKAFVRMPDELELLSTWLELGAETLEPELEPQSNARATEPEPRLRPSLIERMLAVAPHQLAASLEAFIGCVPEWIARIERNLSLHDGDVSTRACRELIVGAESVGATHLASLARATHDSLAAHDQPAARAFLAASEREYLLVFQEAFSLLDRINEQGN